MFEAYLEWNFCNFQHTTFVAFIQDCKQGQDKPLNPTQYSIQCLIFNGFHLILYLKIQFDLIFLVSHNVQDSTKKSAIFSRLDKKQDSSSPLTKIKVTLDDSKLARSVNTIRNHPDDQMESSRNLLKRPAPNSGIVFCC